MSVGQVTFKYNNGLMLSVLYPVPGHERGEKSADNWPDTTQVSDVPPRAR